MKNSENFKEAMRSEPIPKISLRMSLPPMCSMFIQYFYTLVDSILVANVGETELSAVSLSYPIVLIIISSAVGLGVGTNVLIARYLGERKLELARRSANMGLLLAILCGVTLTTLSLVLIRPYFHCFTQDEELFRVCINYMSLMSFCAIPVMIHVMIQKIVQATGDMVTPMLFQMAGAAFNFIFDPLLIYGIGIFPKLGILGGAVTSLIGYSISASLALLVLIHRRKQLLVRWKEFRFERHLITGTFSYGFPSFVLNVLSPVMLMITNAFLNRYSMTAVAFFGIYSKFLQLLVMTANGIVQGTLPLMSFHYGAGESERLGQAYRFGSWFISGLMGAGALIIIIFAKPLLTLFDASPQMLILGIPAIRIMALSFLFNGISTMMATYLQAVGNVPQSVIITLLRQLVLLVPVMWILSHIWEIDGIWITFPVTELLSFLYAWMQVRRTRTKINIQNHNIIKECS